MSEEDDALRELAANRGCKLTKSRRRKAGGDYGCYGLKDAKSGREVFGFGKSGLTATPDEIRAFLRGGGTSTWRTSLGKAEAKGEDPPLPPKRSEPTQEPKPERRVEAERSSKKKPKAQKAHPEPKLVIREAKGRDAGTIAAMVVALGYDVTEEEIRRRLKGLAKAGQPALVAEQGEVIGVLTTSTTFVIHRPRPVGRISLLVVAESARGSGVGTALIAEATARLKAAGCGLLEVTSNMKRLRAHGFYQRLGFERTSYRFVRKLQD